MNLPGRSHAFKLSITQNLAVFGDVLVVLPAEIYCADSVSLRNWKQEFMKANCDGEKPYTRWSIQEYDNIAISIELPEIMEEVETSIYPALVI